MRRLPSEIPFRVDRLRALREARGWSQLDLALNIGTYQAQIGRLEVAKHEPSLLTLIQLCQVFGCSADYLLGLSDHQNRTGD